jgi:hypothetical protein
LLLERDVPVTLLGVVGLRRGVVEGLGLERDGIVVLERDCERLLLVLRDRLLLRVREALLTLLVALVACAPLLGRLGAVAASPWLGSGSV